MAKSIVFVAQDIAPSACFERVAAELAKRGIAAKIFLGKGKPYEPSNDELWDAINGAGALVLGMSSSIKLAAFEIFSASIATAADVPFGFYLDTANCHERDWFGGTRDIASFFFAINESEAEKVRTKYPKAQVIVSGNPLREDAFFPKHTREEVRKRLGVADGEIMVLAPGGKSPVVNIAVWALLLDGLCEINEGRVPSTWKKFRVFLAYHPGDRTPYAEDPEAKAKGKDVALHIYGDLAQFAPEGVKVEVLPTASDFKTSDALPGADLIAEFGSTIVIEAACQRKPIITISTAVGRRRLYAASKTETTEPVKLGLSEETAVNLSISGGGVAVDIERLLDD